jgi:peptidyl-prolyl cis-trans isomerase B (cyclophilin B)
MASNRKSKNPAERRKLIRVAVIAVTCAAVFIAAMGIFYGRSEGGRPALTAAPTPAAAETAKAILENADYARANDPVATIIMADGGEITLELYPEAAPNTVANFVDLANAGFYDGLIFHRVISGFMIQGGDPTGTGMGGPGYAIKGEFTLNGVDNRLTHSRGVISMARSNAYDSAGSQFFIMHGDAAYLDGQYAAFGAVTAGMDIVDGIASVQTGAGDRPAADAVIESIRVDTRGIEYNVEKIED